MTRLLDYIIHHSKEFSGMTDYEKWEYREDVIAGMKEDLKGVGACVFAGAFLGWLIFILLNG